MCESGRKYLTFGTVAITNGATKENFSVRATASSGDSAVVSDEVRSIPTRKEDMIKFESFTFNSKLKVVICHGDIFKSGTQALLTGENRELFPLSSDWKRYCLSKRMSEEQWKTDFKRKHVFIRHSEVYMDPRPIHECFKYVFHAIVYPYHAYGERTWLNEMKKLYENVVKETEIYDISSIAMPLLMTENVPRGYAVDAAVQSLAEIKTTLKQVHIYVSSLDDFDKMCNSCWKHEVLNVDTFVDMVSSSGARNKNDSASKSHTLLAPSTDTAQFNNLSSQRHESSHPSSEHQLENGLIFTVHLEDILKVGADAVVTGESPDLSVMSLVTQKLCESGGIRYNVWRDHLLTRHRRLKFGKVYETSTSITDLPYRYSFHAIMYVYRSGYDMEWATGMDEIYSNIINKAEEKVLRSVVMPLLGS
ncbi:uncharacterized protein LOC121392511, partial [Gigantopelta aegis]|uniref:uncharacterized protein LOC121392511 n=1 Tax=Gigantopelta aegis TaxID=1735272 RepID=UPI001B8876E1